MASSSNGAMSCHNQNIVSTNWLSNALKQGGDSIRLFDATFHLTDKTRDARQECRAEHIRGAQFFDITQIADTDSQWPNTVPSAAAFEQAVRELGVNSDHTIIAYDSYGLASAARVWWLFHYFGHSNVAVLDGGLPKWLADGNPVDGDSVSYASGNFIASVQPHLLRSTNEVLEIVEGGGANIIDARSAGRFSGSSPEPREGLRAGHIPGSISIPYTSLLNEDKTLKGADQIAAVFKAAGVDSRAPIVTSCGSGVTACILALGLAQLGIPDVPVFDGSWTEWGSTKSLPIATL